MNRIDGRVLKALREGKGYSLREFAAMIYTSKSSVQRWEQSYLPESDELLSKIADVFETTVDEMRSKSENYSETMHDAAPDQAVEAQDDDGPLLTPEELAELKFGFKWLPIPIAFLAVLAIVIFIIAV